MKGKQIMKAEVLGAVFWSGTYPLFVVEGANGDLLLLTACWAATVQTQVARSLCTDLHGSNEATVVRW